MRHTAYGALCVALAVGLLATAAVLWIIEQAFGVGQEASWDS